MRVAILLVASLLVAISGGPLAAQDEDSVVRMHDRGKALWEEGKAREARPYLEQAARDAPRVWGAGHENSLTAYNSLALIYQELGEYELAEKWGKYALEMRERKYGKNHPLVAESANNLGNVYLHTGDWDQAEALYRRSLAIRESQLGKNHPHVTDSLSNLAVLSARLGKYSQSEDFSRRSLAIKEATLGKDDPLVARSLNNLGSTYNLLGQYDKAEPLFRRALAILERRFGPRHVEVTDSLKGLASIAQRRDRPDEAIALYRRVLEIREALYGKEHPEVAETLDFLSRMLVMTGKKEEAESLLRRSLAIQEKMLGKEHPEVGDTLVTLAYLKNENDQFADAEAYVERALAIFKKAYGVETDRSIRALGALVLTQIKQEQLDPAEDRLDTLRRATRRYLAYQLPALNPEDQLLFLRREAEGTFHLSVVFGWKQREKASSRARSASWVINGKGLAQEALAQQAIMERNLTDPELKSAATELRDIRKMLATLANMSVEASKRAERDQVINQMIARQKELEATLHSSRQSATGEPWVELAEVQKSIPAGTAFFDIVRVNTGGLWEEAAEDAHPERYVAWVHVGGKPDVEIVDLGEARFIDAAVQAVREQLVAAQSADEKINPLLRGEEAEAEASLKVALGKLSELTLAPLLKAAGPVKELVVSPDGALWLAPWSALPIADGKYAVEEHSIRFVVSGRDLLPSSGTAKAGPAKIFADPDYDLNTATAKQYLAKLTLPAATGSELRGRQNRSNFSKVARLPGTALEAQLIAPAMEAVVGHKPMVYLAGYALEDAVKQSHSPKVLSLATHGYFLPDQDKGKASGGKSASTGSLQNPLLRCGLLFAGCNDATPRGQNEEDGILTGLEVAGCDLRGTELVVLSACETGLGDVQQGEGVSGLRQAFQLAGAQTVVATLWQVPDRDTALLMGDFFRNLAGDKPRAAALREAQLKRIAARRENMGAAHPLYWAAWTLTGN